MLKELHIFLLSGWLLLHYSCAENKTTSANKILSTIATIDSLPADTVPVIPMERGWVNDFVGLFSLSETKSLDSLISNYEIKTDVEITVATADSLMIGNFTLESYSLAMLRSWGVGKKEKNNGILILIVPGLRRIRIENGYGIEAVLSNEETKAIIDSSFIPRFKEGRFYAGTREGILAIIEKLASK